MPWVSRLLRGERVYARATASGAVATGGDGRVDIIYRPGGKVYRASARNLTDDPTPITLPEPEAAPEIEAPPASDGRAVGEAAASGGGAPRRGGGSARSGVRGGTRRAAAADGIVAGGPHRAAGGGPPIIVYADGACTGNPGPCGIGVVILDGSIRRELSEYLGLGTNNIAELTAIIRALEEVPRERTVVVHSDSAYSLGLLGQGWKAKANRELVERMRALAADFADLRLVKVAGHSGVVENERADTLAREAVVRRR